MFYLSTRSCNVEVSTFLSCIAGVFPYRYDAYDELFFLSTGNACSHMLMCSLK